MSRSLPFEHDSILVIFIVTSLKFGLFCGGHCQPVIFFFCELWHMFFSRFHPLTSHFLPFEHDFICGDIYSHFYKTWTFS